MKKTSEDEWKTTLKDDISEILKSASSLHSDSPNFKLIRQEFRDHLSPNDSVSWLLTEPQQSMFNYYKRVFGLIEGRTNNDERLKDVESIYLFAEKRNLQPLNVVNTEEGMDRLFRWVVKKEYSTYSLNAVRGSGKTQFLNYFCMKYNKLFHNNKIIWYRVNLSELHKRNIRSANDPNHPRYDKLVDYVRAHIVYITFKYCVDLDLFKDFFLAKDAFEDDEWKIQRENFLSKYKADLGTLDNTIKFFKYLKSAKFSRMPDRFREMINDIFYLLDEKYNHDQRLLYYKITALSEVIMEFIRKKGFTLLFILDGVDNVDYYESRQIYEDLLKELGTIVSTRKYFSWADIFVYSIRPEAQAYIEKRRNHQNYPEITFLHLDPVGFEGLIEKRLNVASDPDSRTTFGKARQKTHGGIINYLERTGESGADTEYLINKASDLMEKSDNFLCDIVRDHMTRTYEAIKEIAPAKSKHLLGESQFQFVEKIYNNNIRDILINTVNSFSYLMLWKLEKDKHLHDRPYVLYEGQLLNGELFLNSDSNQNNPGQVIKNIFYHKSDRLHNRNVSEWHGLCLLRILQYLCFKRNTGAGEDELVTVMSNINDGLFKYEQEIVQARISKALSGGLISSHLNKENIWYQITPKGLFHISYPFFSCDILYNLCLDTPLPSHLFEGTEFLDCHMNKDVMWGGYAEAVILSSVTFLKVILSKHELEMKRIPEDSKEIYELSDYLQVDHFVTGILSHAGGLKSRDKDKYNLVREKLDNIKNKLNN